MSKRVRISLTIACIFCVVAILFVPQANGAPNYYSNSFDSASALEDGYWSLHDAEVQALNNLNVLVVYGEASFMPQQGNYALNNFTVQFDVWHNVVYENNTAYQGEFYSASDAANREVLCMGYVQRGSNDNETQQGFLQFNEGTSHYYFPFARSTEWSTWRLTVITANVNGAYLANVTLQVDGETITAFETGLPKPDWSGEIVVSEIVNEPLRNLIAYQNLLPMPRAGAPPPTYAPTKNDASGIHYDLLGNYQFTLLSSNNGATPSYVDNFYYGYANTVPLSTSNGESSPSPTAETAQPTINTGAIEPPILLNPVIIAIILVISLFVIAIGVAAYSKKNKRNPIDT